MRSTVLTRLVLAAVLGLFGAGVASADAYKVIVNAGNDEAKLSKKEVANLFMKKTTRWSDGTEVVVADLPSDSGVRESFSEEILGLEVARVKSYWQKMIFSGRGTPPPEVASDTAAIDFVASNPNAIAYVSDTATLGDGVRAIDVVE